MFLSRFRSLFPGLEGRFILDTLKPHLIAALKEAAQTRGINCLVSFFIYKPVFKNIKFFLHKPIFKNTKFLKVLYEVEPI